MDVNKFFGKRIKPKTAEKDNQKETEKIHNGSQSKETAKDSIKTFKGFTGREITLEIA